MKRLLIFLSLLTSFVYGQNIHTRLDNPLPQAYGNIYYKTSWTGTSDFTLFGDATLTLSGTNLSMSCTTTGTLAQYATVGTFTDLSKWTITNTFTAQTPGAATFGNAIGTRSYINTNYDCIGHLAQDNGATKGKMVIERGDGTVLASNSNGSFSFSAADVINQVLSYNDTVATYTCVNVTTGAAPVSISFSYSVSSTTQFTPSAGYFAIYEVGGTQVNSYISITSNVTKNANIVILSDSKGKGYHASLWKNRASFLLDPVFPTTVIHSGGSECLFMQNMEVAEIIAMNPKYAILLGGDNDMRTPYSRSVAATLSSYDSLYNSLTAAGITCLTGVLPEDSLLSTSQASVGLTAFKNAVSTKYASSYIDFWTPMTTSDNRLKSAMDFGDGIHPNDAGNNAMAAAIINCGLILFPKLMDSMAVAFSGVQNLTDSSILYNNHSTIAGISNAVWNGVMMRLKGSNSTKFNISSGTALDGLFIESAAIDGGNVTGGGYYDGTNWKSAGSTAFSAFTLGNGGIAFYMNPSVTPFSTITPSLQYTFLSTLATFTPPLTVTGAVIHNSTTTLNDITTVTPQNTAGRHFLSGTLGIENYASVNNELLLENADVIGATFKYKANGFAEWIAFQNGHFIFATAPSGSAGATISGTASLDLSPTTAVFGVSVAMPYHGYTGTHAIDGTDYFVDCTANSFTITLPTAVGIAGREYILKNSGSVTTITIATTSSQTIDGSAPGVITTAVPTRVISDGANWKTW